MLSLIDSHAHIQFPAYEQDREAVIARAREAGVGTIAIGTQVSTSETAVSAVKKYPDIILGATAGFHPGHLSAKWHHDKNELEEPEQETFNVNKLRDVAKQKEVVAIGECGLDYFRLEDEAEDIKKSQRVVFLEQINLAKQLGKPLVIHCRAAFPDLIEILTTNHHSLTTIPGVIHFFSGTKEEAAKLVELGFYIAFGGVVTFVKDYDEVVKFVPLDKIVLETDAPYVAPVPFRGKRNEPAYIIETAKKIAEIKGFSFEEVVDVTTKNTKTLFGL